VSYVNNAILTFDVGERTKERIAEVNAGLESLGLNQRLRDDDLGEFGDAYGGSKCLEHNICVAAFNYVTLENFLAAVRSAAWNSPENVRVFWCDQEEDAFEPVSVFEEAHAG
jgi:hypothetical protein